MSPSPFPPPPSPQNDEESAIKDDHEVDDPKAIIAKASANADDEYHQRPGSDKNYYSIAHTLREPVYQQPSIMINGTLKEYQVRLFASIVICVSACLSLCLSVCLSVCLCTVHNLSCD